MTEELYIRAQRVYIYIDTHNDAATLKLRSMMLLCAAYMKNQRKPPGKLIDGILIAISHLCAALKIDATQEEMPKIVTHVTQNLILNASDEELDKAERSLPPNQ